MSEKVFLVHGIFMHGYIMQYIQRQLQKRGYVVYCFSYRSVRRSLSDNAALFIDFVENHREDGDICHFVGHSLGGLLIRHAYALSPECFSGKVVTLGTPHNGSEVAKRVVSDLHEQIIGGAFEGALDGQLPPWQGLVPLGSIAGDKCIGLGTVFNSLEKPNDGTVTVKETQLTRQTDHIILPLSHTAMVYSSRAVKQVDYFLSHGKFLHE